VFSAAVPDSCRALQLIGTKSTHSDLRKDTFKVDYLINQSERLSGSRNQHALAFQRSVRRYLGRMGRGLVPSKPHRRPPASPARSPQPSSMSSLSPRIPTARATSSLGTIAPLVCAPIRTELSIPVSGTKIAPDKVPSIRIQGLTTLDADPIRAPGRVSFMDGPTLLRRSWELTSSSGARTWNIRGQIDFIQAPQPDRVPRSTRMAISHSTTPATRTRRACRSPTPLWATSIPTRSSEPRPTHLCSHLARSVRAGQLKATTRLTVEYERGWSIWPQWHSKWGNLSEFLPQYYDPKTAAIVDRRADSSSAEPV